jgi:hypothetical protein
MKQATKPNRITPQQARESLGLSLEQMAKRVRLHPRYLRRLELHGGTYLERAKQLGRAYGCRPEAFLYGARVPLG